MHSGQTEFPVIFSRANAKWEKRERDILSFNTVAQPASQPATYYWLCV
jgi:hypothetical protein